MINGVIANLGEPVGAPASLTVGASAVSIDTATIPAGANCAYVTVEASTIRFWMNGTATEPTASVGHEVTAGSQFTLLGPMAIRKFRAIRTAAPDGVCRISFFSGL